MEVPFERGIYVYLSNLCHVVSEYVWLWGCISKILGVVFRFSCTFRRETPFGSGIYTYLSNLCHVVSEYIWLWVYISKILGVVTCFFLHLQEEDALWKQRPLYLLIQVSLVMSCSFRIYMTKGMYLQNPKSGYLFFLHLQEEDALLKGRLLIMIYTLIQVPLVM